MDDHLDDKHKVRPDGIQYAKLSSMLSFKEVDPNHTVSYKFNWFHQLPVKSKKSSFQNRTSPLLQKNSGPAHSSANQIGPPLKPKRASKKTGNMQQPIPNHST